MATGSEKRQERSEAREQRRSLAAKPFEAVDEAAGAEERNGESHSTLRQAAKTAAAGALAAGIAGAAKALADRRDGQHAQAEPEAEHEPQAGSEPEAAADESAAEPEAVEPQAELEDEEQKEDEQPKAEETREPKAEEASEPKAEETSEPKVDSEPDEEPQAHAPQGASTEDVSHIVEDAKRNLEELLGVEAETVSGFNRSDGRWTVTLEVVTVRRVPDTTDVLSTYEVAFDDDRNLVSLSEVRRYRRSHVEEGR